MIPFPDKKYQIIYADPPWKYKQGKSMGTGFQGAADAHYSCMDYLDICKLAVNNIADDRCILFMWVTFPFLKEGLTVIESWGFEYKTLGFIWVKINPIQLTPLFGVGYYAKSNTEPCLMATKGDAHKLVISNSVSSVIVAPKTKHSQKPPDAKDRIIKLCGDLPRIELFARQKTEGWDVWGNEVCD